MSVTKNNVSASLEDYLEAIYNLPEVDKVARSAKSGISVGSARRGAALGGEGQ